MKILSKKNLNQSVEITYKDNEGFTQYLILPSFEEGSDIREALYKGIGIVDWKRLSGKLSASQVFGIVDEFKKENPELLSIYTNVTTSILSKDSFLFYRSWSFLIEYLINHVELKELMTEEVLSEIDQILDLVNLKDIVDKPYPPFSEDIFFNAEEYYTAFPAARPDESVLA